MISVAAKLCHSKISQGNNIKSKMTLCCFFFIICNHLLEAATNAVYDYVSPLPSSADVPTKPNNAYASLSLKRDAITRSIHTETNVAYAIST